jgi:hypothetical protein
MADRLKLLKLAHYQDTRQYLSSDYFLTPLSAAAQADKTAGALAVVAGLIACRQAGTG